MSKTFMKDLARLCILKNIIFLFSDFFFFKFFVQTILIFLLYDKSLTFIFYVQSNLYIDCKLLERFRSDWYWMIYHLLRKERSSETCRDLKRVQEIYSCELSQISDENYQKYKKKSFFTFLFFMTLNECFKYIWYLISFL